jgi:hypothetical protein
MLEHAARTIEKKEALFRDFQHVKAQGKAASTCLEPLPGFG